ncbi:MAG: alkaline phosphatase D family protein [Thermodesulfobacteriota bacterium]
MSGKILLGPLLGLEDDTTYTVCFLSSRHVGTPQVVVDNQTFAAEQIQETPNGKFWRAAVPVPSLDNGRHCSYHIQSDGSSMQDPCKRSEWKFYVPGKSEEPRIAYASCNGFSSGDMKMKVDEPYRMWRHMAEEHKREPFSLLIMGGDQIYADEIWHSRKRTPLVAEWSRLGREERISKSASLPLQKELDRFYENLYMRHWNQEHMSLMMATIPSVMMWDDHDIFDGWGSYPDDLQNCPVYIAIFEAARHYFELFQIRSNKNKMLLRPSGEHYSFAFQFRDYGILGLDNRSNRTGAIVMDDKNWSDVKNWLSNKSVTVRTLLVLSAVPVVYRDFRTGETAFDITPWQEELADDIRDQWCSRNHEGERMKLIMNMLNFKASKESSLVKRVILSGDVHVGCLGIIRDHRQSNQESLIYQVISSAIVHPAPTWYQWLGILVGSNHDPESLEAGKITTEILDLYGSDKFLRTRNYATLKEGTDGKLWVNWFCENGRTPVYPILGSPPELEPTTTDDLP